MWSFESGEAEVYSSPHTADLNKDGILDIVLGGGIESSVDLNWEIILNPSEYGVFAINGATGEELWSVPSNDQIFTSAVFIDITGDTIPDTFMGGRNANLMAINGATGEIIWEFYPDNDQSDPADVNLFQFYTPQVIRDVNFDGRPDLLVVNGGDKLAASFDEDRPIGKLMIISSLDGTMLASADVPDGQESYMSPLVYQPYRNGEFFVIFGTGGEAQGGSLYIATLQEVIRGDLSGATVLASNEDKGYIAPPTLADVSGDNIHDIIVNSFGGVVSAINGRTYETIWEYTVEGGETSSSPTVGHFNDDEVPDVFTTFGIGIAPSFSAFRHIMISGADGSLAWSEDLGLTQFGTANAVDLNDDGTDEVLFITNQMTDGIFTHEIHAVDFVADTRTTYLEPAPGTVIFSTPWIGNLDGDQSLDLVYLHNTDGAGFGSTAGVTVKKVNMATAASQPVAWGCYLGAKYDAVYKSSRGDCANSPEYGFSNSTTTLACIGDNNGEAICTASGCPCMTSTCQYLWDNGDTTKHAYNLDAGYHYVTVTHEDFCVMVTRTFINEPSPVKVETQAPTCVGNGDGQASVINENGNANAYSYTWPNQDSTMTAMNLEVGIYELTVTYGECTDLVAFEVVAPEELALIVDTQDVLCADESSGTASFSATGGTGEFSYFVDGEAIDSTAIGELALGDYQIKVVDSNGCETEEVINIGQPEILVVAADPMDALCAGDPSGSLLLSASGGTGAISYSVNGVELEGAEAFDLLAGEQMVLAIDSNGCSSETSVMIEEPTQLIAETTVTDLLCHGAETGSISADLSGGTPPYRWVRDGVVSDPTSSTNIAFSLLGAGEFTVGFMDANDCMVEFSTELTQPDSLYVIAQVSADESVAGMSDGIASLNVQGGVEPYSYQWDDDTEQTDYVAYNLPGGTYTVYVTDANDCVVSTTVEILTLAGVSVEDAAAIELQVYPNPGKGIFSVNLAPQSTDIVWNIISSNGKRVAEGDILAGDSNTYLDLTQFSAGVYFLQLRIDDDIYMKKLILH